MNKIYFKINCHLVFKILWTKVNIIFTSNGNDDKLKRRTCEAEHPLKLDSLPFDGQPPDPGLQQRDQRGPERLRGVGQEIAGGLIIHARRYRKLDPQEVRAPGSDHSLPAGRVALLHPHLAGVEVLRDRLLPLRR